MKQLPSLACSIPSQPLKPWPWLHVWRWDVASANQSHLGKFERQKSREHQVSTIHCRKKMIRYYSISYHTIYTIYVIYQLYQCYISFYHHLINCFFMTCNFTWSRLERCGSTLAFMMSLPRYGIKAAEEMVVLAIRVSLVVSGWSISLGVGHPWMLGNENVWCHHCNF